MLTTVVIPTIDRDSLSNSIRSALNENFPVIVVGDGITVREKVRKEFAGENVKFTRTGQRFGCYGAMAANVGGLICETEFGTSLGDDDEFIPGKGQVLLDCMKSKPEIDIWIPNVIFGPDKCNPWYDNRIIKKLRSALLPTFRVFNITQCHFSHPPHPSLYHAMDLFSVDRAVHVFGHKLDWVNDNIYKIGGKGAKEFNLGEFNREVKLV